jgi:hypothetical protein
MLYCKGIAHHVLILALLALIPTAASSAVANEYLILILFVGTPVAGVDYEICAFNPTDQAQEANFEFRHSGTLASPEEIVLNLDPGETECYVYQPSGPGVLSQRVPAPASVRPTANVIFGNPNVGTPIFSNACSGLPPGLTPPFATQVWLRNDGKRTEAIKPGFYVVREAPAN